MQDMGPLSLMPYFSATLARALQPVQHGQQLSALHQGKQPPRPALSMAAPKMHGKPKHVWQQQAMPQSLTMWQLQIRVSHCASAITERLAQTRKDTPLCKFVICGKDKLTSYTTAHSTRVRHMRHARLQVRMF